MPYNLKFMPTHQQIQEELAYRSDFRVLAASHKGIFVACDTKRMTLSLAIGEDGKPVTFPATYEVCSCCEGRGTTTNPSMDCNGLDTSNMEDEEVQAYFAGAYDIVCPNCDGKRVELAIARDQTPEEDLDLYNSYRQDAYEAEQTYAAEMRMGC